MIEEKKRKEKEKEDKKTKKEKGAKLTKEEYLKQAMQEKSVVFLYSLHVIDGFHKMFFFKCGTGRPPKLKKPKNWQPLKKPSRYLKTKNFWILRFQVTMKISRNERPKSKLNFNRSQKSKSTKPRFKKKP